MKATLTNSKSEMNEHNYKSYGLLEPRKNNIRSARILLAILILFIAFLCLPWTQNVESTGAVIALQPDERPQAVETVIAGRIEKWFVQEGDSVKAGDTLLFLSEVKVDYFDPNLLQNTEDQLRAKESSVGGYMQKITSLDSQIDAMLMGKNVKKDQTEIKIDQTKL
ncbi:MAG: biotin/lipoyl-binding protein, partial [Bacteroidota bacterium]